MALAGWAVLAVFIPFLLDHAQGQDVDGKNKPGLYQGIGSSPLDLVLLLDTSINNSVSYQAFKDFMSGFLDSADIDSGLVRVAFVSFSSFPYIHFKLNQFNTKQAIQNAVQSADFRPGERNTADALDRLRKEIFIVYNGDRRDVPNAVLLLTTGTSDRNNYRTLQEAEALRYGNVNIFAMGMDLADATELEEIASKPTRENTFQLYTLGELDLIQDIVFAQIFTRAEQAYSSPATASEQLDLAFLLHVSSETKKEEFEDILNFMKNAIRYANIDSGDVKIGCAGYRQTGFSIYNLDRFSSLDEVVEGLAQIPFTYRSRANSIASGLNTVKDRLFVATEGDRPSVPNAVILITNANANVDVTETMKAAEALRATGASIFAYGIGKNLYAEEFYAIAGSRENVYTVNVTADLAGAELMLQDSVASLRTNAPAPVAPETSSEMDTDKTSTLDNSIRVTPDSVESEY